VFSILFLNNCCILRLIYNILWLALADAAKGRCNTLILFAYNTTKVKKFRLPLRLNRKADGKYLIYLQITLKSIYIVISSNHRTSPCVSFAPQQYLFSVSFCYGYYIILRVGFKEFVKACRPPVFTLCH